MKKQILVVGLLLSTLCVSGAVITDDFNRLNVGPTSDGSAIGSGWVIASEIPTGISTDWSISNGTLQTTGNALIYHQSAAMGSAADTSWEIRADVSCDYDGTSTKYIGVLLNYDPVANHGFEMFMRMPENGFGAYACEYGSNLDSHTGGSHSVGADETVRVIVSYDAPAERLQMDVWDTGLTTKLAADTFENMDETLFSGGYMGLVTKGSGTTYTFDNVKFTVPEPATGSLVLISSTLFFCLRRIHHSK